MSDKDQPAQQDPVTDGPAGEPTTGTTATEEPEVAHAEDASTAPTDRSRSLLREIASGDALAGVLAVFLAVLVGSALSLAVVAPRSPVATTAHATRPTPKSAG